MALQDDINLFVNKANTKIGLYTDEVELLLRSGMQSDKEVALAAELIDFIESLIHVNCPWTDAEKIYWMAFMEERHSLTEIAYQDYDPYYIPSIVINGTTGTGVTLAQVLALLVTYTNTDISLQQQIDNLQIQINNLLPPTLIGDVIQLQINVADIYVTLGNIINSLNQDIGDLAGHIADTDVHIQPGERDDWNSRVTQAELTAGLDTKADLNHTHPISEVVNLQTELDDLQNQINNINPADGLTPDIQIGTVVSGDEPLVELDPLSTPAVPIFNFTLKSGDPFTIDVIGILTDRSLYDNQASGFTFMDDATGEVYIRMTNEAGTWSPPIQFRGYNGWSPIYSLIEVDVNTVVKRFFAWIGGTGPEPDLEAIYSQAPGTYFYAGATGFVTDINLAVNVKGTPGDRFKIDIEGTDKSLYDNELKGYTFLDTNTGKISFKLSDTSGDWSAEFAWSALRTGIGTFFTAKPYAVWTGVGLIFNVIYPPYYIQFQYYAGGVGQTTLNVADITNPRLDIIGVDALGPMNLPGDPAVDPVVPTIDPLTQLEVTTVLVNAGATTPEGFSNIDVYKENVEWVGSGNVGGLDFDSVLYPFAGTKHIYGLTSGSNQFFKLTNGSQLDVSVFGKLTFRLRLASSMSVLQSIRVRFLLGANIVSNTVTLSSTHNFSKSITATYQYVVMDMTQFQFTTAYIDAIYFEFVGQTGNQFAVDNIILQLDQSISASEQRALVSIVTDSGAANATGKDDTFYLRGGRGLEVSATGKVITINQTTPALHYEVPNVVTHGFTVGNALKKGATVGSWALMDGTVDTQDLFRGVVVEVIDADNFVVALPGSRVTGLSGLTAGAVQYVQSDGTLGDTVTLVKGLFADSATTGYLLTAGPSAAGGGGHVIQDSGTPLAAQPNLNFTNGLFAADDDPNTATVVKLGGALLESVSFLGNTFASTSISFGDPSDPLDAFNVAAVGFSYFSLGETGLFAVENTYFDSGVEGGGGIFITTGAIEVYSTGHSKITVSNQLSIEACNTGVLQLFGGTSANTQSYIFMTPGSTPTIEVGVGASTTGFEGIKYADDFSADFVDESLINLGFANATYEKSPRSINNQNITGTSPVVDLSSAEIHKLTITGNVTTLQFTNMVVGKRYYIVFIKETTNKTLTFFGSQCRFVGGTPPTLTDPTANGSSPALSYDVFEAVCTEAGWIDMLPIMDLIKY